MPETEDAQAEKSNDLLETIEFLGDNADNDVSSLTTKTEDEVASLLAKARKQSLSNIGS